MLEATAATSRFLGDGDAMESRSVAQRPPQRAQPMSLAQLLAVKRAATSAGCGSAEQQQHQQSELAFERESQAPVVPWPLPRATDYSVLQRRIAEQRQRLRIESAVMIQRCFRRYQHRCYVRQCRAGIAANYVHSLEPGMWVGDNEQELVGESLFIPFNETPSVDSEISPPSPPIWSGAAAEPRQHTEGEKPALSVPTLAPLLLVSSGRLPRYLVDIQLVSTRGLLSESDMLTGGVVDLELTLCAADQQVIVKRGTTQVLQPHLAHSSVPTETTLTEDASLQFAQEEVGITEPQAIIDEWSVRVVTKVQSTRGRETRGNVDVPLVLLATGLASEYSLCRWFPLEKSNPGDSTRGELRLSIRMLARKLDASGCEVMAPYAPVTPPPSAVYRPSRRTRDGKKPFPSRRGERLQPSTIRRPKQQAGDAPLPDSSTEDSRPAFKGTGRTATSRSPDSGEIPRAEVISPPSSPASTSSSDVTRSPKPVRQQIKSTRRLPLTQHQTPPTHSFKSPERRISLAERMGRLTSSSEKTQSTSPKRRTSPCNSDEDQNADESTLRRPFLKRKPYKVVFQRLDWSNVPSKTDSRLGFSVSSSIDKISATSRPYQSQAKATKGGSSGPSGSSGSSESSGSSTSTDCRGIRKDGDNSANIDSTTKQRIDQLETAMRACCGVSDCSASLIQLRYQMERKKFGAAQARRVQALSSSEDAPTASSVEELWQQLADDSIGEFYVERLNALEGWAGEAEI